MGKLVGERIGHLFNEEIAERDACEARLAIADGIEHSRIGWFFPIFAGLNFQQGSDFAGHSRDQGDLDEYQRFIRQGRVEESETTPDHELDESAEVTVGTDSEVTSQLVVSAATGDPNPFVPYLNSMHSAVYINPA